MNSKVANKMTLGDRMKLYESVTTSTKLIPKLPVYARIDGRAFHSFTRGFEKPFDMSMVKTMQETTRHLVSKTHAMLGYVQSDEISLCWREPSIVPFETRLFKLESVLAGMASSYFSLYAACIGEDLSQKFKEKTIAFVPHFDCRIFQLPNIEELANVFLWRERDSIKNSITLLSLEYFSNNEIHKKNSAQKIEMLKEQKGIDYYSFLASELRLGTYMKRRNYMKVLTDEEVARIPKDKLLTPNADGSYSAIRSRVENVSFGCSLDEMTNKTEVLFNDAAPTLKNKQ